MCFASFLPPTDLFIICHLVLLFCSTCHLCVCMAVCLRSCFTLSLCCAHSIHRALECVMWINYATHFLKGAKSSRNQIIWLALIFFKFWRIFCQKFAHNSPLICIIYDGRKTLNLSPCSCFISFPFQSLRLTLWLDGIAKHVHWLLLRRVCMLFFLSFTLVI